jgi:AAA+ ATPase superfamily predicted ATPase
MVLINPFRYGDVATGESFTDRRAELNELETDIRNGQNVVVISPRRYGKTSLAFRAIESLRRDGTLIAYLDLFRAPTKDRLADHLADALYSGLVAPLERVWDRAVDVFQKLSVRPKITVNPDGMPSFEFTAGERSRDIDRTIEDLLTLPVQIARQRKRRVALVLDEFQEIVALDPRLPGLIRAVFQVQPEVAHIFLGSKRHLMERVFTHENEPLYKLAKPLILRPINPSDFSVFICEKFSGTGQSITDDALDRLLTITGGRPHDTQELSYFTWSLAQAERTSATPALVDRALAQVLEAEDARFTTLWEQLSAHQRLLLTALIDSGESVYSEAYRRQHRLGPASSVQKSLDRLIERELVESSPPGAYRLSDPFLQAWIVRLTARDGGRPPTPWAEP